MTDVQEFIASVEVACHTCNHTYPSRISFFMGDLSSGPGICPACGSEVTLMAVGSISQYLVVQPFTGPETVVRRAPRLRVIKVEEAVEEKQALTPELAASPISRERMDLLWLDGEESEVLSLAPQPEIEVSLGIEKGGPKSFRVSKEDVEWARQVDQIAAKASAASARRDFKAAIALYQQALKLAPGADIYLMSLGACYANLGKPKEGLPYLERASQISPQNARIAKNLQAIRSKL